MLSFLKIKFNSLNNNIDSTLDIGITKIAVRNTFIHIFWVQIYHSLIIVYIY